MNASSMLACVCVCVYVYVYAYVCECARLRDNTAGGAAEISPLLRLQQALAPR